MNDYHEKSGFFLLKDFFKCKEDFPDLVSAKLGLKLTLAFLALRETHKNEINLDVRLDQIVFLVRDPKLHFTEAPFWIIAIKKHSQVQEPPKAANLKSDSMVIASILHSLIVKNNETNFLSFDTPSTQVGREETKGSSKEAEELLQLFQKDKNLKEIQEALEHRLKTTS